MDDIYVEYRSRELFPFLQNRVFNRSRADFERYRRWIGLAESDVNDPLVELAASGGPRATDPFQLYRVPEPDDGRYIMPFFVHGVSHTAGFAEPIRRIEDGERLFLQLDIQNPHDDEAISLRTSDPKLLLGHVLRILTTDFKRLVELNGADAVGVYLSAVNNDGPTSVRYRCYLETHWPTNFRPFQDPEFETIPSRATLGVVA